ncbi:MAG: hypothetical protein FDZ69_03815 [Deltaproteobacteria bacterium]|nr:MAG: hypothetical protein FDZ69_03815 [Deltaproteobacteria bacterium]
MLKLLRNNGGAGAWLPLLLMGCLIIGLTAASARKIKGEVIVKDGRQNAAASYYLWTEGRFTTDGKALNYKREPLPVAVTALYLALFTDIPREATPDQITGEERYTREICQVNLVYVVALLASLWWLSWLLTRSHVVSALTLCASWRFLVYSEGVMGNVNTELPMAWLLVLMAALAVLLFRRGSLRMAALFGAVAGAATLTKAGALYVGVVAVPLLALAMYAFHLAGRRRAAAVFIVAAGAFALVVVPWMTRNYLNFGAFAVAQRGGDVLLTRAVKDRMTPEEYRGAFYVYAPRDIRAKIFEPLLGFDPRDLEPGGRYQRLIRDQPGDEEAAAAGDVERAISYYARAHAMQQRIQDGLAGTAGASRQLERLTQKQALGMIREAPGEHLLATVPFAWRGIWSFNGNANLFAAGFNLLCFLAFLSCPLLAILWRRPEWLAFSLFGFGLFWFYALLSHFIPRYSDPLIPLTILAGLVLARELFDRRAGGGFRQIRGNR